MAEGNLHNILLESGTNELELLVFKIADQCYGVNVAKVREVIDPVPVTQLPLGHPNVVGVFQLRDSVIPLVNLPNSLSTAADCDETNGKIIVMEFNDQRVAFLVDAVNYIHRVNVDKVEPIPDVEGVRDAPVTFIVQIDEDLVQMVDFEKLVFDIAGVTSFDLESDGTGGGLDRGAQRILMAEDSHTMRKVILANLNQAGFTDVKACNDGQDAWEALEQDVTENGSLSYDLIITDIEMPQVDGLRLTWLIKNDDRMKDVPVVIFSSLVSSDNEKKCKAVGANAQITKPQLGQLVDLLDELLSRRTQPVPA